MFDGTKETFEMLKRPDTVKIITIKNEKIVILEQRQPHTDFFYDIPGGIHDAEGENELRAAQRELKEETGIICAKWKLLKVVQTHSKIDSFVYNFLAYDVIKEVPQELDGGEVIKVHLMSLDEIKALKDDPKTRSLPLDILNKVNSIKELFDLPEYS